MFSVGGTRENLGRNLRDITGSSDSGKIVIENSFGSLEEDTPALESMEGFRWVEENKENTIYLNQHRKGKSMNQGKEGNIFKGLTKGNGLARDGPSEKGTGRIKGTEANWPKSKSMRVARPIKGLIFGLVRGELELSESGKRLRIEKESVGRPGGVFVKNKDAPKEGAQSRQVGETSMGEEMVEEERNPPNGEMVMQHAPSDRLPELANA